MLSMKTLRVAIVTMGSALLLGSGLAAAQTTIELDAAEPATPLQYAVETLDTDNPVTVAGVRYYALANDGNLNLQVTSSAALDSNYYVRVGLSAGMIFNTAPKITTGGGALSVGGASDSVAVFTISKLEVGAAITIDATDALAISNTAPGSYSASISVHRDQFDAYDNIGAISSSLVGGSAVIVTTVSGINGAVTANRDSAVADVSDGFLSFTGGVANASLGSVTVAHSMPATGSVLNAANGLAIAGASGVALINATGVTVGLEGNLGIGAWNLVQTHDDGTAITDTDTATAGDQAPACVASVGSASAPFDPAMPGTASNFALDADDPNMATAAGLAPGTYMLCVTVDTAGPMSNATPIPSGEYTATAYSRATTEVADNAMVAEGVIGRIERNGTTVNIAYLTDSEKYNQRLIIVNRSNRPAEFDLHSFTTEVGSTTTVALSATAQAAKDAGLNVIPPNGQVVVRVADILEFTGERKRRVGATLSLNANVDEIQVATTQVNLEDGSTDTVIYASEEGVRVN